MGEVIVLPLSAVIPTRNRSEVLKRTLQSLAKQSAQPEEIVIIDSSENVDTFFEANDKIEGLCSKIKYHRSVTPGAASQRNEGVRLAKMDLIFFMDDDLLFEPGCIQRLFSAIEQDATLGGVSAMITNQKYETPGWISRALFSFLSGNKLDSYAGRCIGPVMNILPEDSDTLPDTVPVEWLNTTCTIYKREALPNPPFPPFFSGYSLFEDVCLSVTVGKRWKLANARTARVYHDSQPGDHKNNIYQLSKMELVNRYFVMTQILGRTGFKCNFKLFVLELYKLFSYFSSVGRMKQFPFVLGGKFAAVFEIINKK